jgi:hypothetical protein
VRAIGHRTPNTIKGQEFLLINDSFTVKYNGSHYEDNQLLSLGRE